MTISIDFEDMMDSNARIKVVGAGGGGGNAVNTMIQSGVSGVEFIAANTDTQALEANLASVKIQLGSGLTRGLGAGANPDVGKKSAMEEMDKIAEALHGADMVFITAGMGGGTGTGAAPIIAQVAKDLGALTVAVVTKPFSFEGKRRMRNAEFGFAELANSVDTIITIPNEKLLLLDDDMTVIEAFRRADDVLVQAVRGISDLITQSGMINVDFADVRTIMQSQGRALMGTGYGKGDHRTTAAVEMAINSPLLDDVSIHGAMGVLLNFTTGPDVKMREIQAAATLVQEAAHDEANIIYGHLIDPSMGDVVKVTAIATGFELPNFEVDASRTRASSIPFAGMPHAASMPQIARTSSVPAYREAPRSDSYRADSYRGSNMNDSRGPAARRMDSGSVSIPSVYTSQYQAQQQQAAQQESRPASRAFGPAAIADEATLDIPAYLRRAMQD